MTSVEETKYSHKLEAHIRHLQHTLEALIHGANHVHRKAERGKALLDAQMQLDVSKEWTADLLAEKIDTDD